MDRFIVRYWFFFLIACISIGFGFLLPDAGFAIERGDRNIQTIEVNGEVFVLPSPQSHPLSEFLSQWQDSTGVGDYFEAIAPSPIGYLVWPRFPITVFVEPFAHQAHSAQIYHQWRQAVLRAIEEWSMVVPLELSNSPENADITLWAKAPPLQIDTDENGLLLGRARSAATRYEFYLAHQDDGTPMLMPRYEVMLKPGQGNEQAIATARHELGHALGLWGHSPSPTDALYFSQVQAPPAISDRDINTLKRLYEQPTQIGWPLQAAPSAQAL